MCMWFPEWNEDVQLKESERERIALVLCCEGRVVEFFKVM